MLPRIGRHDEPPALDPDEDGCGYCDAQISVKVRPPPYSWLLTFRGDVPRRGDLRARRHGALDCLMRGGDSGWRWRCARNVAPQANFELPSARQAEQRSTPDEGAPPCESHIRHFGRRGRGPEQNPPDVGQCWLCEESPGHRDRRRGTSSSAKSTGGARRAGRSCLVSDRNTCLTSSVGFL
jgi:hypothetical protein